MSRKILFFINPIAGNKKELHLEKRIIRACEKRNAGFEILFTSKEGDYNFLHEKIKTDFITDIVICGGDGSIRQIIASVLKMPVNIGIIPLGSGNGLARTAGIPKSINKALKNIFEGKPVLVDAFMINDQLSCHVSGLGFDARVAHIFSRRKTRGLNTYTKIALSEFLSARTYSFEIKIDKNNFSVEAFLVCIANSNQFGNNFKIAPKANICDGLLDIVILKKTSKAEIVLAFVKQLFAGNIQEITSKDVEKKNILYFQTNKIIIKNHQLAPLHVDGDPLQSAEHFSVEILPSAYNLICP